MTFAALLLALVSLGAVAYAVLSNRAARAAKHELDRVSHLDILTGLPGRRALVDELARLMGAGNAKVGVIVLELGRFGAINETYGHEIGDAVMVAVAQKLRAELSSGEQLFRLGGPQFTILVPNTASDSALGSRTAILQKAIDLPLRVGRDKVRITTVAGLAVQSNRTDPEELLQDASIALHEAFEGERSHQVFEMSFRNKLTPATAEKRLRSALENDEFELVYMPVVSLWENTLVGFEALLRWADPDRGLVSPAEFLKVLDDTGLIVPVGAWVIDEACRQAKVWQDQYPDTELTVTINVSPRQLMQTDFVDVLADALRITEVGAEHICLEIAEGGAFRHTDVMWSTLRGVKTLGVQLALDDFGVGFSSLNYIRSFELDVVKIEPTFVKGVADSRDDQAIVGQIVGLAHALGLTAVAEGVDAKAQADALQSLGCDLAQGFYFSQPRPVAAAEMLIKKGRVVPGEDQKQSIDWKGR